MEMKYNHLLVKVSFSHGTDCLFLGKKGIRWCMVMKLHYWIETKDEFLLLRSYFFSKQVNFIVASNNLIEL